MSKKMTISAAAKHALGSRVFLVLWALLVVEAVALIILTFALAKIGQPGVPYRYDGFSMAEIFRDNGSYLLNFVVFAVVVPVVNSLVSLKLYAIKGRNIGLAVLWLSVVVMAVAIVFAAALFGLGNVL
jgi:hypothetical protein